MLSEEDLHLWGRVERGAVRGTAGYEQFCKQAAQILSRMPYNLLYASFRIETEEGKAKIVQTPPKLDNEATRFRSTSFDSAEVIVEDNKIINLYRPDGKVNENVLRTCLERLDTISFVAEEPPKPGSKQASFRAVTGRDRLLDFMREKAKSAQKEYKEEKGASRQDRLPDARFG